MYSSTCIVVYEYMNYKICYELYVFNQVISYMFKLYVITLSYELYVRK